MRIGGGWHFVAPREGTQLFDESSGGCLLFRSQWQQATTPTAPSGGTVVDVEARAAIIALTEALMTMGVFASTGPGG